MKRLNIICRSMLLAAILVSFWTVSDAFGAAQSGSTRRVRIIAFVDCSDNHTKRFFQTTYRTLKQTYGDRVEFVLRHAPRPKSSGELVAEAVYCANDQFRQWDYIGALASGPTPSDKSGLVALAANLGINPTKLSDCLDRRIKRPFVESDLKEAQKVGLRGVPAFFVQGEYLEGGLAFGAFRSIIDRQLQAASHAPVKVQIVHNKSFALDDPHKYYSYLNTYFFPESELSLLSHRSAEGQKLVKEMGARALPVVIFSKEIEQFSPFSYFQNEVEKRGQSYMLKPEGYTGILEFMETPAVGNNPVKGSPKAPVTITDFSDFECHTCAEFAQATLPKLAEKYIKTGQARVVFRNYPLTRMHPNAENAAIAGECAQKAGIFWPYHDKLFENNKSLDKANLIKIAESLGQDGKRFGECLTAADMRSEVQKDISDGNKFGIRSTPTLLINNYRVSGGDTATMYAVIDYLLRKHAAPSTPQNNKP